MDDFERDYHDMVQLFRLLPAYSRDILLLPLFLFVKYTTGIWDPLLI